MTEKDTAIVFWLSGIFNVTHPRFKEKNELDEYDAALLKARHIGNKSYFTIKVNMTNVNVVFNKRRLYFHKISHRDFTFLARYYNTWTYQCLRKESSL